MALRRRRRLWLLALVPALVAVAAAFLLLPVTRGPGREPEASPAGRETNILIIGRDARAVGPVANEGRVRQQREESCRSDIVIIAHANPGQGRLNFLALPRDLLVEVPGITAADSALDFNRMEKLGHVHAIGGEPLLRRTVERLLGITIHRYVAFDFDTFRMTFGALAPFIGRLRVSGTFLTDRHGALMFVRRRHGLKEDDIDRCRNALLLLRAVLIRAWWLAESRLGQLTLNRVFGIIGPDTDLTVEEVGSLAAALNDNGFRPAQARTAVAAGEGAPVTMLRYNTDLSCYLPALAEIRRQVRHYLRDEDSVKTVSLMTREEYRAPGYLFDNYLLDSLSLLPADSTADTTGSHDSTR